MNPTKKRLRLDSMTLRGIGSYFDGAELKFRPLTILCGTNGSGKSTWFNSMAMLQRSLLKGKLPFAFDTDDGDCHDMQWTNARINMEFGELATDTKQDDRYGPPGTIGLTSIAMEDGPLLEPETSQEDIISNHRIFRLLSLGKCTKDTTFRVRLAHSSVGMAAYHQELVELVVDGIYTIRMTRARPRNNEQRVPIVLECSRAFVSADGAGDDEMIKAAEFYASDGTALFDIQGRSKEVTDPDELVKACVRLILAILEQDLRGFFRLTAIREKQEFKYLDPSRYPGTLSDLVEELQKSIVDRTKDLTTDELLGLIREELPKTVFREWIASHHVGPHGEASHAVLNAFAGYHMYDPQSSRPQTVEDFVSFWMKKLVQVEDYFYHNEAQFAQLPPRGWVDFTVPYPRERGIDGDDADSTKRWMGPGFRSQSQGPARFSSGFHQLLPIVTQCAMMSRGEIVAIENPEVHLHPKLQLEVADFLMQQALTGRTILVETHSDLIIRRLMRAVLAEEIKQEALSIQFISRKSVDSDEAHSVMEALRINDEDRIDNWPEGFMDDDLKESRRLLNVMYGIIPGDGKEGVDGTDV